MLNSQNNFNDNLQGQGKENQPKPFLAIDGSLTYLYAIAINMSIQLIVGLFFIIMDKAGYDFASNLTANLFVMLMLQVGFVSVYYRNVIFSKRKVKYNLKNKITPLTALLGVLLAVLSIVAFYGITYWFTYLLNLSGYVSSAVVTMKTPFQFVLGCFVLVIAAPIGEELIFRSALLSGLKTKYGVFTAVLFSAFAFMIMHMNPQQTMYQFLLAIVLGFAVIFSGSPYLSMIIHGFSNLIAILIDYTIIGVSLNKFIVYLSGSVGLTVLVSILSFVIFSAAIVGVLLLIKKLSIKNIALNESEAIEKTQETNVNSHDNFLEKKDKVFFWLAAGICIFMWIVSLITGYLPKV